MHHTVTSHRYTLFCFGYIVSIQYTKVKEIVRQHELTRDARATYSALLKHHRNSTASTIAARNIMAFLTTSTIGDGRVKGTTSDFISYWCDQARFYQQLLGDHSSLSNDVVFDIDTPVDMFYAHAAASHKRPSSPSAGKRVFMTREQWSQLDDDTKKIWSTIPEKFKAIILGKSLDHSNTRRQSNVHELQPKPEPDPIFDDNIHTESSPTDTITAHC